MSKSDTTKLTPMEQAMNWERMSGERLSDTERKRIMEGGEFTPPHLQTTTRQCADPSYSTRPEGHAAHGEGKQYRDCPYIRGEDRWAWEQGWIAAEVEQRRRIAAMP